MNRPRLLAVAAAVFSFGVVGLALVSQYVFDMQPCPWCVLQRLIFICIGIEALVAVFARQIGAALMFAFSLCGVAASLWQHFVAKSSVSCNLTLADRIISGLRLDERFPEVFVAYASCADAAVSVLGVPYEVWSLAAFLLLGASAIVMLRRSRPRR